MSIDPRAGVYMMVILIYDKREVSIYSKCEGYFMSFDTRDVILRYLVGKLKYLTQRPRGASA